VTFCSHLRIFFLTYLPTCANCANFSGENFTTMCGFKVCERLSTCRYGSCFTKEKMLHMY
jgi:hypothetical protein